MCLTMNKGYKFMVEKHLKIYQLFKLQLKLNKNSLQSIKIIDIDTTQILE